jgi:hypothetical protein
MLYVLDFDGIEHNNPSLDLYQRLTERCSLWIDDGPRRLDDVMDTIMAGATNITLREDLWPAMDLLSVSEITDDEVYIGIKSTSNSLHTPQQDIGVVVFDQNPLTSDDFHAASFLKDLALKHKIYLYTGTRDADAYWEERGIAGVLVDLRRKEGTEHGL